MKKKVKDTYEKEIKNTKLKKEDIQKYVSKYDIPKV